MGTCLDPQRGFTFRLNGKAPCFETGLFLTKREKTEKKHGFPGVK
jgi:hypothetical protein